MKFKSLALLDRIRPLFEKMGIDYDIMRNILYIKLLMDGRRVPTVFGSGKKQSDSMDKNQFIRSLWIYLLMGVILIPFIMMKNNYLFQMSMIFGIVMFLVITSLISDFSSVLLDIRDRNIIGVRPVDQKTLSMAKTIHILIYMICLTGALCGPALLISIVAQGPAFFFLFFISLIFIDIISIIFTTFIYFLILKYFDGEKLKDIINYIQIVLALVVMIGYQLIGRMFSVIDIRIEFVPSWWQYFVIPIWFAAPFQILQKAEMNSYLLTYTVMAAVIPLISIYIYIKKIPMFEKYLLKMGNNSIKRKERKKQSEGVLLRFFCRSREERIFFRFAKDMMNNERQFKLKAYPSLGFSLIIPFVFIIQRAADSSFHEIAKGRTYLFIYFCGMMLPTLVMLMGCSENYKAAWIYKVLPIKNFKQVFHGTMKAIMVRLFVPLYGMEAIIFIMIYGMRIIPDILVAFVASMIYSILCFTFMEKTLPFSKQFDSTQQSNVGLSMLLLLMLGFMAGAHFAITYIRFGVLIYLAVLLIIFIILWENAFHFSKVNKFNKRKNIDLL